MSIDVYLLFLLTTVIIVFSPGPAAITVASQGAANGFKPSLLGVLGVANANVIYFVLSATGIASLIIASNILFSMIKWVGVLYLVYLGVSVIFSNSKGITVKQQGKPSKLSVLFRQGLIVELANPKALLYFSSLLPQFINLEESLYIQLLIMGVSCFLVDLIAYGLYGYFGHKIAKGSVKSWMVNTLNKLAGGFLIFAGIRMAAVSAQP